MRKLWEKYKELIVYVFFGAVTTLVNFVVFKLCNAAFGEDLHLVSNVIAWVAAVIVAYITNKLWVFESKSWAPPVLRREIPTFVGARVFSLVIEELGLWLTIDMLHFDRFSFDVFGFTIGGLDICKVTLQVVVLLSNYIFSKLVIFKKKAE